MPIPALAGIILFCTVLPACTGASPPAPITTVPSSSAPSDPINSTNLTNPVSASWADSLGPTPAPENWQVKPCDNPVLLCVEAEGERIGTVERFSYSLREINLQGGVPNTPAAQRQFLDSWVADHYATIQRDRAGADPNLTFTPDDPVSVKVGSLSGLRYGFTITHPNGAVFDRTVGYVATDGDQVYGFVTGVISGDPTGSFAEVSDLDIFEPYLTRLIAGLRL